MPSSRATYESRMHRVLLHIDRHIAGPLELAALARVANFSAFHFHRLFAAWTGERVGDYVRRRRLELAATRLVTQPDATVLSVALAVGFGSAEAFARRFKLHFGESPGAWRRQQVQLRALQRAQVRKPGQPDSKPDQASGPSRVQHGNFHNATPETAMHVRLENLAPASIAYLRHVGPYGEPVGRFWVETFAPWMEANGLLDAARYGISHDDPSIVSPGKCRYDACVEVPAGTALSGKAQRGALPGGRYAVLDFRGDPRTINDAWTALLRDWLPASGLQMDNRPCFEYYPVDAAKDQGLKAFSCRLCVPVAAL